VDIKILLLFLFNTGVGVLHFMFRVQHMWIRKPRGMESHSLSLCMSVEGSCC
jgi:hypothetical protein